MKQLLLWWAMFLLLVVGLIVGYNMDGMALILSFDHTYLVRSIIILTGLVTVFLGYRFHAVVFFKAPTFNLRYYHFISRLFPGIGLVGTILGFVIISQTTDTSAALYEQLKLGMGTAFFTTIFGIIAGFFIELEALLVEEFYEEQPRSLSIS